MTNYAWVIRRKLAQLKFPKNRQLTHFDKLTVMNKMLALVLAFSGAICSSLNAQNIITTFAGGPKVFTGALAVSTPVAPSRIAVGPKGEVYFGEREANDVIRLNADGTLIVVAGNGAAGFSGDGGPATQASLNQPAGLAVDAQGNLYIADVANFRVRKVDTSGIITTVAGSGTQGFSGDGGSATSAQIAFNGPFTTTTNGHTPVQYGGSIAVDTAGNLYIADSFNNRVRKVSGGVITTVAGNGVRARGPPSPGWRTCHVGSCHSGQRSNRSRGETPFTSADSAFVRVTPAGTINNVASMINAVSLATDPSGKLYVSTGGGIDLITPGGQVSTVFSIVPPGGGINNAVTGLFGIAADGNGNIYATATLGEASRSGFLPTAITRLLPEPAHLQITETADRPRPRN